MRFGTTGQFRVTGHMVQSDYLVIEESENLDNSSCNSIVKTAGRGFSFPGQPPPLTTTKVTTAMTASAELYGFPSGYFVIRNVANGRLWDVGGDDVEDGIEILLWPEKDKSLVESEFHLLWRTSQL